MEKLRSCRVYSHVYLSMCTHVYTQPYMHVCIYTDIHTHTAVILYTHLPHSHKQIGFPQQLSTWDCSPKTVFLEQSHLFGYQVGHM